MLKNLKNIILRLKSKDNTMGIIEDIQTGRLRPFPGLRRTNIISITNQKGGCAKTTTAINLSALLAYEGFRVLLIDLDPQAHASFGLGLKPYNLDSSIYDVLLNRTELERVIQSSCVKGLDVAASNSLLSGAQLELANFIGRETILKLAIQKMSSKRTYDYIILDCSPTLNLITINALCACQSVLIPIQAQYYALEGMRDLFSTIDIVKERINMDLKILGILVTLFDNHTDIQTELLRQLQDFFKDLLFKTVIHINTKLMEAPIYHLPVHIYDSNCLGALEYKTLTKEIISLTQFNITKEESPFKFSNSAYDALIKMFFSNASITK